ncbi:MAG TPA: ABC transporter substrate-binding protein [Candidatus Limnocylindrales bacterium]|nr:ABC transporter substrate-binding protein [Candidatus Limnocylindrales bacterium]
MFVVAACGAGASPSPSSESPSAAATSAAASPSSSVATSATPLPSGVAFDLPPAETTDLTIGLSNNLAANQFVDVLAQEMGIFEKYGLNVKVVSFEGDGKLVQALVAGQLQGGEGSGGPVISAAVTDTPLQVVTVNATSLPYDLLGAKDIKTAADLKGKQVAISSFGSTAHAVVLAALDQLGLQASDVTLQQVGSESTRIAAVLAGSVAAAPVTTINSQKAIDQGLNALVDLTQHPVLYDTAGLNVRKDWAAKNPNTILRLIAALTEAQKVVFTDPDLATQKYMEFTQLDHDTSAAAIAACADGSACNKGFTFSADNLVLPKQVTLTVNPAVKDVDPASVIDTSYLQKLKDLGFNAAIAYP